MKHSGDLSWMTGQEARPLEEQWLAELANRFQTADQGTIIQSTPQLPFHEFVQRGWHVIEPSRPFVDSWSMGAVCEHLEAVATGQLKKLIINIPPRNTKSTLTAVLFPAWVWTFAPEYRWLFGSYSWDFAKRDAVASRALIQSPWYQSNWGSVFQLRIDQNEKRRYVNDRTGFRISTSVGGGAIGDGADIRVIDDPIKPGDIYSDAIRDGVNTWWSETWSTRWNDPLDDREVIIMQRLHEMDLCGYINEAVPGEYENLILPMHYNPEKKCHTSIGFSDPREEDGELLNPERFNEESVKTLAGKLGSAADAQLEQDPVSGGGNIFKNYWLKFWVPQGTVITEHMVKQVTFKTEDGDMVQCGIFELPDKFHEAIQSWDMAFKDTKISSFVCGQVWARYKQSYWLIDQVHKRLTFTGSKTAVKDLSKRYPNATAKLIEDKANGPAIMDSLRLDVHGLIPVPVKGGKIARAHAVSPLFQGGNVYLPHPAVYGWVTALIAELIKFPRSAQNDRVDTVTQALRKWITGHKWSRS